MQPYRSFPRQVIEELRLIVIEGIITLVIAHTTNGELAFYTGAFFSLSLSSLERLIHHGTVR